MTRRLVLASASPSRRLLLERAGLDFETMPSAIDERVVESTLAETGAAPEDLALVLAEAKAADVAARQHDALTIGADQTLSLGDEVLHKVADMEDARRRLLKLSGRSHHLHSAVVLAKGPEVLWRHVSTATMTMRRLDPGFVGRHLAAVGDKVLRSVGAYQYENEGIQLFERIEGDYFTILGLPMIPLLDRLRSMEAIDG